MSAEKILSDWKNKLFKQVYWLEGEEDYYIDMVIHYAEHNILPESEAGFNLTVFYGKDAAWNDIVNACMRYPMFAERQVVILKEAQQMRDIDKLEAYIENPLQSTIFVIGYKEGKIDKRKKLYKSIVEKGVYFFSEKIRDYKLGEWVTEYLQTQKFSMSAKAIALLTDHIGNDLSRIVNELEKITINLGDRKSITEDDIEKYVGVSKEYNVFELQDAISKKDLAKAVRIIQYIEANPKSIPVQMLLPALYTYFSKLYAVCGMHDTSEAALKPLFSNNIFAVKQGLAAAHLYRLEGIERALLLLHEYNLKSVGVNTADNTPGGLLKELVAKIIR